MEDELSEYNAEGWAISCYHDEVVSVPLPSNKYKKSCTTRATKKFVFLANIRTAIIIFSNKNDRIWTYVRLVQTFSEPKIRRKSRRFPQNFDLERIQNPRKFTFFLYLGNLKISFYLHGSESRRSGVIRNQRVGRVLSLFSSRRN
jgi:hypothetical protein